MQRTLRKEKPSTSDKKTESARLPDIKPASVEYEPPKVIVFQIGTRRKVIPAYMGNQ